VFFAETSQMLSWAKERLGLKPEPPAPRGELHRSPRYTSTLPVVIEGKRYSTVNWSAGGLRLGSFQRHLEIGDRLKGEIAPLEHMPNGSFEAEVVHVSRQHGVGLRFVALSSSLTREISRFA
jgi:hypothetical protein